jgi:hypothetical protein
MNQWIGLLSWPPSAQGSRNSLGKSCLAHLETTRFLPTPDLNSDSFQRSMSKGDPREILSLAEFNFVEEPRAGEAPPAFGGGFRNAENLSGLSEGQAGEVTHFHQLGFSGILFGQKVKGFVSRQQFFIFGGRGNFQLGHVQVLGTAAAPSGLSAPSPVDKDPSHGLGCSAEKVAPVFPIGLSVASEAKPGFVNKRGRLERMVGGLADHFLSRHGTEFLISNRHQLFGGFPVALAGSLQQRSEVAHAGRTSRR